MTDRQPYSDQWADKLQQVPVPDVQEAWLSMEVLLDQQMPVRTRNDKRRWLLLIVLLLLLIGVCNCPGRGRLGRLFKGETTSSTPAPAHQPQYVSTPAKPSPGHLSATPPLVSVTPPLASATPPLASPAPPLASSAPPPASPVLPRASSVPPPASTDPSNPGADPHKPSFASATGNLTNRRRSPGPHANHPAVSIRANHPAVGSRSNRPAATTTILAGQPAPDSPATTYTHQPTAGIDGLHKKTGLSSDSGLFKQPNHSIDSGLRKKPEPPAGKPLSKSPPPPSPPAVNKKPPPPPDDSPEREKGWMVGIGLNQFFTVGQQQSSGYNSDGLSGTLRDYIPVPMVRYYFDKKLFVQLEVQFNTPQYTRKNLLASQPPQDTLSPVQRKQSSVYIKKLFYFNVPLSVHYSPFDNWNAGAGIQFSRLTNGIGLFQDDFTTVGVPDSTHSEFQTLKGDSIYQKIKTDEFRVLADLSYTYKKFILGVRYNQALSKFLNVRLANNQVTQARNSSLQLYLRYILWDGRKKPLLPTK